MRQRATGGIFAFVKAAAEQHITSTGRDYSVSRPMAATGGNNVELTPTFSAPETVHGILEPLDFKTAFEVFGVECKRPHRLSFKEADAAHFIVGGWITGDTLPFPLYVVAAPRIWPLGETNVEADVLLDIEGAR